MWKAIKALAPKWLVVVWEYRRAIGLVILVAALGLAVYVAQIRGAERDNLDAALTEAKQYIVDQRAAYDAQIGAMERTVEREKDQGQFRAAQAARRAGADDGPLAPVLRGGLQAIKDRQARR